MEKQQKTETIIYGGAFNPPTLAHEAIIRACVDYAESRDAEVWLLPSGDRTDKEIPTPREKRLGYLATLIAEINSPVPMAVVTTELDRTIAIETADTVDEFERNYPDRQFTWVFGADSIETMPTWQDGPRLLGQLSMLVLDRPGYSLDMLPPHATRLDVVPSAISSTEARRRIASGESLDGILSPRIQLLTTL